MGDYTPSYKGVGEMLCAEFMVQAMRARGEKVKVRAIEISPVGPSHEVGVPRGHYRDSFEVEAGVKMRRTRRAYARVRNTAKYASFVEFGTSDTPKFRVLGKAIDAAK